MANNPNPDAVQADAATLKKVWGDNTDFKLKDVTFQNFKDKTDQLTKTLDDIEQKELELTPLRNDRDGLTNELKDICVRVRAGMKGYFGADSSEYEQAGGTRASERKKPNSQGRFRLRSKVVSILGGFQKSKRASGFPDALVSKSMGRGGTCPYRLNRAADSPRLLPPLLRLRVLPAVQPGA